MNPCPGLWPNEILQRLVTLRAQHQFRALGEEEQEIVFERFHRGRAGRTGPAGSGLGLPIARELARAWSGDVVLEHREGGGARAIVSLPRQPQ